MGEQMESEQHLLNLTTLELIRILQDLKVENEQLKKENSAMRRVIEDL